MSNMLNKILMGVSVILICICGWLYYSKSSLEKENIEQADKIINLETDLKITQSSLEIVKALNKELDSIVQSSRKETEQIRQNRDDTLDQLKEIENVKQTEKANSDSLDPELRRLLDNLCTSVRGSTCPNP